MQLQRIYLDTNVLIRAFEAMSTECSHILSSDADFEGNKSLSGFSRPTVVRPTAENLERIVSWLTK